MPIIKCYVDDRTMSILNELSRRMERTVESLAEAAIEDAAIRSLPPSRGAPPATEETPLTGDTES